MTAFTHPLARKAEIWTRTPINGKSQETLVVITTLELDTKKNGFKSNKINELTSAIKDHLNRNSKEADGFLLMNRPRDWAGDREA